MDEPKSPFLDRPSTTKEIERGHAFMPKFDADGLIPAIVTDAGSGAVLMFAWMNGEALLRSIEQQQAWFWSRSRKALWRKGEASGNTLSVVEMRTDCDQDVVWLRVEVGGGGAACHTGKTSCFYRTVALGPPDLAVSGNQPAIALTVAAETSVAAPPKL